MGVGAGPQTRRRARPIETRRETSYLALPPGFTRTRHRVTTEAESDPVTEFMRAAGDGRHHSRADRPAKLPGALGDFATTPTQQPENSSEGTTKARETEHQGSEPKRLRDSGIGTTVGNPKAPNTDPEPAANAMRRTHASAPNPSNRPRTHQPPNTTFETWIRRPPNRAAPTTTATVREGVANPASLIPLSVCTTVDRYTTDCASQTPTDGALPDPDARQYRDELAVSTDTGANFSIPGTLFKRTIAANDRNLERISQANVLDQGLILGESKIVERGSEASAPSESDTQAAITRTKKPRIPLGEPGGVSPGRCPRPGRLVYPSPMVLQGRHGYRRNPTATTVQATLQT